jgi:hypothetical protein
LEAASDGCAEIVGRSQRALQNLAGFLLDEAPRFFARPSSALESWLSGSGMMIDMVSVAPALASGHASNPYR